MRLFECPSCSGRLFFANSRCGCGAEVDFDPERQQFVPSEQPCANRFKIGCNWPAESGDGLCRSCAMTDVTPDLAQPENVALWSSAERSKRWVLATMMRWGWFTARDSGRRPVFHMLAEATWSGDERVVMGHANGLVTISVNEADPVERLRRGESFGEPLRSMIGHFRHELGHFFFERFAADPDFLTQMRALFGDERADYHLALNAYYSGGPPADWPDRFVSAYAASHPHEDWAESFAHLLHLTDIVDSVAASGLTGAGVPSPDYDAYLEADTERLISIGAQLGVALNHVNRSMGLADIYPFVLSTSVQEKITAAHRWVAAGPGS